MKKSEKIAVLVTTDSTKRGVFSGLIAPDDIGKENVTLEDMRMCVYWSQDMKGVLGLASMGPSSSCRISKAVKKATISGAVSWIEITDEAYKKWQKEPWG